MEGVNAWRQALARVEECLAAGITEFVVCGGARNAALLAALAGAEKAGAARVWSHFEERGAGFFALGRCMAGGAPCAVVTTSGTAAAELLPAAVEAHYQARPLVLLTADRPAAFRHSGSPQTIIQPELFGPYAATSGLDQWSGREPLHINAELDENPVCGDFPAQWETGRFSPRDTRPVVGELARWLRGSRLGGLALMLGGLEPCEREEVFHFCQTLRAPVLAEAASGLREALGELFLPDGDRLLAARPPEKILRLGETPSGRFWRDLENMPEVAVWSVCRNGLPGLARESGVIRGPLERVLPALGEVDEAGDARGLLRQSAARQVEIDELLEAWPDSEPGLVRALSGYAAFGSGVFLGNSMPLRQWNLFAQTRLPFPEVRANRGANGIDGQISAWLGWSAAETGSWGLFGDLTALYDIAAGALFQQVETRGRRLAVINNRGGDIFSRLPRMKSLPPRAAEWMRNTHRADFSGMAKLWGLRHLRIRRTDDFDAIPDDDAPLLLEILPDPDQTNAFWRQWNEL